MHSHKTDLVSILLLIVSMCIHPAPVKAVTLAQSVNRLDVCQAIDNDCGDQDDWVEYLDFEVLIDSLEGTNMYGVDIDVIKKVRERRERVYNLPTCPIKADYWWNLDCA